MPPRGAAAREYKFSGCEISQVKFNNGRAGRWSCEVLGEIPTWGAGSPFIAPRQPVLMRLRTHCHLIYLSMGLVARGRKAFLPDAEEWRRLLVVVAPGRLPVRLVRMRKHKKRRSVSSLHLVNPIFEPQTTSLSCIKAVIRITCDMQRGRTTFYRLVAQHLRTDADQRASAGIRCPSNPRKNDRC